MSHALPTTQYIVCHRDGTKEKKTREVTKEEFKSNAFIPFKSRKKKK